MAAAWGARYIDLGARGHINGDSGLGDWPQGLAWLEHLSKEEGAVT
jgi:predicted alpha/beta hydrolase family esterase